MQFATTIHYKSKQNKQQEDQMIVYLKCFAILASDAVCDYRSSAPFDLPAGQTILNLIERLGMAREAVKIAFVNNKIAAMDTVLADGDRVALAPAVGGM